jgi:hypothetical protein
VSLYPTPTRKALLRSVAENDGQVYFEAGEVWDNHRGGRVTDRMRSVISAGWVEVLPDSERNPRLHLSGRTYYRLTDDGNLIIQKGRSA